MLTHSSLDHIEYNNHTHSTQKAIKSHRRRSYGQKNRRKFTKKFHSVTDTCAVCLDDSTQLDTKLFPCGHTFHGECLFKWVQSQQGRKFNCPLCRRDIAHFIQMIPNKQLNDGLTQMWNERYLYKDSNIIHNHSNGEKPSKCTDIQVTNVDKTQTIQIITPPTVSSSCCDDSEQESVSCSDRISSITSAWKYIRSLALYPIAPNMYSAFNIFEHSIYSPSNIYNDILSCDTSHNKSLITHHKDPFIEHRRHRKYPKHPTKDTNQDSIQLDDCPTNENEFNLSTKTRTAAQNTSTLSDMLRFDATNFKAGIFAGICAGSTTYVITEQLKSELLKQKVSYTAKSLYPFLAESVPNVAIFFTSYEHLKRYLFQVDNVNNGWYQTYSQRFLSAGIASSVACVVSSGSVAVKGLLPLRFAAFFGTFELCKDVMNTRHEELNIASVAASAAIGGSVAHSLYFPVLRYRNMLMMKVAVADVGAWNSAKSMFCRDMYRGFVSSLNKFLPSCVVCSCAFEYSKRYFNS